MTITDLMGCSLRLVVDLLGVRKNYQVEEVTAVAKERGVDLVIVKELAVNAAEELFVAVGD